MLNKSPVLDTPPPTPVSWHYTGDPDVGLAEVSGTKTNMANNAFIKLPEFWEFSQTAWFAQTEAQFAIRDITDDTLRYYHVVSALGRSTATRAESFIANPPNQGTERPQSLPVEDFLAVTVRAGPTVVGYSRPREQQTLRAYGDDAQPAGYGGA